MIPIRMLLVDDHEVVREGLRGLLGAAEDIEIVGEATTAAEAIAMAERLQPNLVVMDVRLAGGSGIEATRDIRSANHDTQVLMLTSFQDDEALFASILAGAAG